MDKIIYVNFLIGKDKFAINAKKVVRFFKNKYELLPFPGNSKHFMGIISLKIGSIPVLNPELFKGKLDNGKYIIIFNHKGKKIALIVDEINNLDENLGDDVKLIDINSIL